MTYTASSLPFWIVLAVLVLMIGFFRYYETQAWRRKDKYLALIAGLIMLLSLWQVFLESFVYTLRIDDDQMQWQSSTWLRQTTKTIRFADVACFKTQVVSSGKSTSTLWYVKYKKDPRPYISLGPSRLLQEHRDKIEQVLQDKKIPLNSRSCGDE